jgi:threonine dehydratase
MKTDALNSYIPTLEDMLVAHERIKPYVHRTPVLTSSFLNDLTGAELFFKCENFQKAGAFKVRGASNAVFGLSMKKRPKRVSPPTARATTPCRLSYAAGRRGIPCHVVMPRTAPQAKKDAVRGYGGIITECEPSTSSREAVFAEVEAAPAPNSCIPTMTPRDRRAGNLFQGTYGAD